MHLLSTIPERIILSLILVSTCAHAQNPKPPRQPDLVTPVMTTDAPAAGKRVRQIAPEYANTKVHHALYLPKNWSADKKHPVIVEYTGNRFPTSGSSGKVADANLGYGMTGGKDFIWVVMPCVDKAKRENALDWWGDREATVNYCKTNLPRVCKQFAGEPENVFLCGFSRGAIAAGYIGMADDEIAGLWKGIFTHDHFDGHREWGYKGSDRKSALKRLTRLKGRPVLICGQHASNVRDDFLVDHLQLAAFTFLDVPTEEIFDIPDGKVIHPHTDMWMHRESEYRKTARDWLKRQLAKDHEAALPTQ